MGYNWTKMANIRPKWPELDQIIYKKLMIKEKIDLKGQDKPINLRKYQNKKIKIFFLFKFLFTKYTKIKVY